MKYKLTACLFFISITLAAQDSIKWANHVIENMPLGRGLDINYSRIFKSNLVAESKVSRLTNNEVQTENFDNLEFDLKFPIYVGERTQVIGSGEYTYDRIQFRNNATNNYELFEILNKKELRSRKLKFYVTHSLNRENFLKFRTSIELNGDVADTEQSFTEFAKYSLTAAYGWQKSAKNAYAVGLYMNYALGRSTIYPVFEWNKTWNNTWGFESKLPAQFKVRYTPTKNLRVYAGYGVDGLSYRLVAPSDETNILEEFEIRKSDLKFTLNIERRLYDFIWIATEGGLNYNIRFEVADNDKLYNNETIIDGQLGTAPYLKFSLFLVPNESLKSLFGYNQ